MKYVLIRLFVIGISLILLQSCGNAGASYRNPEFRTIIHEECEYVVFEKPAGGNYGFSGITHKGNCRYCKTRSK